jgi:hypothetical protein
LFDAFGRCTALVNLDSTLFASTRAKRRQIVVTSFFDSKQKRLSGEKQAEITFHTQSTNAQCAPQENTMDTANNTDTSVQLVHGEVLAGVVDRPFIQDNKLLGAVLRFPGRKESALLHIKQMIGTDRDKRLSDLKLGQEVRVKLLVSGVHPNRKIWASELELTDDDVLARVLAGERKNVPGRVINTTNYGVFVQVLGGPGTGRRGLVHVKNLYGSSSGSLGDFTAFPPGSPVNVDIMDARMDNGGLLRMDLCMSAPEAAA